MRTTIKATAVLAALATATFAYAGEGEGEFDTLLADGNSTAGFNDQGQISWIVDGVEQLFDQQFYFRRSTDTREYVLGDGGLGNIGSFVTDTNPFRDDRADAFGNLYADGQGLEIETVFTLRGGNAGSGRADLAESITIRNTGLQSISLSFFQYVDFDLGGDSSDDTGWIVNGNTVRQEDAEFSVAEVVVTPAPHRWSVGNYPDLVDALNDDDIDNLDNNSHAEGDIAWGFQWNITIAAGQSFIISKDKSIVPAPGALALLGLSAGLVAPRRRR
jgi:hypothetical protein